MNIEDETGERHGTQFCRLQGAVMLISTVGVAVMWHESVNELIKDDKTASTCNICSCM